MRWLIGIISICSSVLELISTFSAGCSKIIRRCLHNLLRYLSLVPISVNGRLSSCSSHRRCKLLGILLLLLLLIIVHIFLSNNHRPIILKLRWIFSIMSINFLLLLLPLLCHILVILQMLLMLLLIEMKLRVISVVAAIQNSISLFRQSRCLQRRLSSRLILRISKLLAIDIVSLIILR